MSNHLSHQSLTCSALFYALNVLVFKLQQLQNISYFFKRYCKYWITFLIAPQNMFQVFLFGLAWSVFQFLVWAAVTFRSQYNFCFLYLLIEYCRYCNQIWPSSRTCFADSHSSLQTNVACRRSRQSPSQILFGFRVDRLPPHQLAVLFATVRPVLFCEFLWHHWTPNELLKEICSFENQFCISLSIVNAENSNWIALYNRLKIYKERFSS